MDPEISRRNFLKWGGLLGAAGALPEALRAGVPSPGERPPALLESDVRRPAVCKLCPALCMLDVRVAEGKPVGVSGKAGHPVSGGALCPKGGAILQDLYHPDRLRFPILRKGERGGGRWERVSWDEAERILRTRLSGILAAKKPERLAMLAAPIRDIRHELQKRFARSLGTPHFWEWDWPLGEGPTDAFRLMHGSGEGLFYDLSNANHIVSFGWDWLQAFPSPIEAQRAYGRLRRGRAERRTRMIQIEPRLSVTASKADEWVRVRPGTEGVLALGLAHVLLSERLHDEAFVKKWTLGFREYSELVLKEYGPQRVSDQTGVEEAKIAELAREMAAIRPALAITNRGEVFTQVAVHGLNALLGSLGVRRGVLWSEAEKHRLSLPGGDAPPLRLPAESSAHLLPEFLASGRGLDLLWLERVNPVFLSPEPERWRQALRALPFIVSFSSFLDETSELADLVLPPHHGLEAWQYGFTRTIDGDGVLSFAPPVIRPMHDTCDHGDFILRLARSLGDRRIAEAFPWKDFVEALGEAAGRSGTEAAMREGGWRRYAAVPAEPASTFGTAVPALHFAFEALRDRAVQAKPPGDMLDLQVFVPLAFSFGEGAHLPYLHSVAGIPVGEEWGSWLEMHPDTAKRLGIKERQEVWVESPAGKVRTKARYFPGIDPGAVAMPLGLGHTAMGRYAQGVGANPAALVQRQFEPSGRPLWRARVRVYAA